MYINKKNNVESSGVQTTPCPVELNSNHLHSNRSVDLKDLFTALAKAQAEIGVAGLNSENPYFKSKYANFTEMIRVSRPALTKHGLSVLQPIVADENGNPMLYTILCHSSGQWIEARMKIAPPKNDIQTLGSYITYLRRYNYSAMIGICTTNGEDDGEIAMRHSLEKTYSEKNTGLSENKSSSVKISKDQLNELRYELEEYPNLAEEIITKLKIKNLAELPKNKYFVSMKRIREIKELKKEA